MNITRFAAITAGLGAMLAAGSAMAAWPPSVVGHWTAFANQSPLTIDVSSQSPIGDCNPIAGTLTDTTSHEINPIQGFYCPHSGRMQFLRKVRLTNDTFQVYTANVSMVGGSMRLGGTFAEDNSPTLRGEYNFWAIK